MKMRQSLAELERDFRLEAELEERRRVETVRHVAVRSQRRSVEREKKRRSMRFYVLCLSLVATAIIVTVAMFATLYLLLT